MTIKEILKAVHSTLEQIEVKGSGNMDKLLGCIQTLERVCAAIDNEEKQLMDEEGTEDG